MQHYDIAIVGGGLVGASFAHAIAGSGLRMVMIDKSPTDVVYNAAQDNRGLAISYTTKKILDSFNVWSSLASKAFAICAVHVSEQGALGFTKLEAASCNLPALGYVVSATALHAALVNNLDQLSGLTILRPETITTLEYDAQAETWQLNLTTQTITAKLLVAAHGINSSLGATGSVAVCSKDYGQTAIVTNVGISHNNLTIAYERFTQEGVLAFLPFGAKQMKCVWTVANKQLPELMQLSDIEFLARLQRAIGFRLGKLNSVDARKTFPIVHAYADQIYSQAQVLLGNAANTLHPVAAQGFNLGVRDATILAHVLRNAIKTQQAFYNNVVLKNYAALRMQDQNATRNFSHNLVAIFSHSMPVVKAARKAGLIAAQLMPGLNKKIIARGLGTWM